jgi:oligopeptide transport system ATP-binding protein
VTLLDIDALQVSYGRPDAPMAVVREVSLSAAAGECLGIVGESGAGKTQLFLAAMGLLPPEARVGGSVRFEGREIIGLAQPSLNSLRGAKLAMIFQDPMSSLTPHLKIGVQLAEVLVEHRGASWLDAGQAALSMLERVHVPEARRRMQQYPHELSGGMRQRVMIGMALLCEPKLLIADEPTSALDATVQAQIIELLRTLRAQLGMTLIVVSHDVGAVAELADRIVVMYGGRIVESGAAAQLLAAPRHPYTDLLLKCVPNLHVPRLERMPCLSGQAPGAGVPEAGCAFAPRCPQVMPRCRSERPELGGPPGAGRAACHYPLSA